MRSRRHSSALLLMMLLLAGTASAQTGVATFDKATIGGDTLGDVLRLLGLGTVGSGSGTINPLTIDNLGDVREDTFTTVSTAGAHTWSAAGSFTSTLGVTGVLSGNTGTLLLGSPTRISTTAPSFLLHESDAGTDEKYWEFLADADTLTLRMRNDVLGTNTDIFNITRAAMQAGDLRLGSSIPAFRPQLTGVTRNGIESARWLSIGALELDVTTLTAEEKIARIGGVLAVVEGSTLVFDVIVATTTIHVKHNGFRSGDVILLQANGKYEKMQIASNYIDCRISGNCAAVLDSYAYTVTRGYGSTGANEWFAGDTVVNEGTTGDPLLELIAKRSGQASGVPGQIVADGPLAYWRMNESPSGSTPNLIGVGPGAAVETGTQSAGLGVATCAIGPPGCVGPFDPAWQNASGGGYLTVTHHTSFQITGDLTLEWIMAWENTANRPEVIMTRGGASEFHVQTTAAGALVFAHGNTSTSTSVQTAAGYVPIGGFHHYAIVRDAQSTPKRILFLKDGVVTDTFTYTQTVATTTNNLGIGENLVSGTGTSQFDGILDEVAIYNYQVSADRLAIHSDARTNSSISRFTVGPTATGWVRTGTGAFDMAQRWACGNLAGSDYSFSSAVAKYGCGFGDSTATHLIVDATDGVGIWSGTTRKFHADTSGNLSLTGDLAIGTAGSLRSGASAYDTDTGYWLDYNGGSPRFRIGTTSSGDAYLRFTGTELELRTDTITMNDAGIKIEGNATGSWVNSSAYYFDYGDSSQTGMASIQGSIRDVEIASRRSGSARVSLKAEDTADGGLDARIEVESVNVGLARPSRIHLIATDLLINNVQGFTGTKVAGSCTFVIADGIVTDVTGC